MSIFTVSIAGVTPDPEVYGGLVAAVAYVGAMFGPAADAWLTMSSSAQGRTLRAATLYLDRQAWDGTRTGLVGGTPTTLAFPRAGVLMGDGTPLDSASVPLEIVQASFELAVLIAADPAVVSKVDQGSNLKSVGGAGVPTVEFFAPTSVATGTAPRMPLVVQQLVGRFLATAAIGSVEGGFAGVGSSSSRFRRDAGFRVRRPE